MGAFLDRTKEHKKPIVAVGAAGGGTLAVGGVGLALTVAAAVAGVYFLERARRRRGELGR